MDNEYNLSNPSVREWERMHQDYIDEEYAYLKQMEDDLWKSYEEEIYKGYENEYYKSLES